MLFALTLAIILNRIPNQLETRDGYFVTLEQGYQLTHDGLVYWDALERSYLLPYRFINFARTFRKPPEPPPVVPEFSTITKEVPWHLPAYRDKQRDSFKVVEITNEDIQPPPRP